MRRKHSVDPIFQDFWFLSWFPWWGSYFLQGSYSTPVFGGKVEIIISKVLWSSSGLGWVILRIFFKIPSCVTLKGKFVANVSFDTVRLINHSLDRIKYLASCFIKNICLRLPFSYDGNICLYRHNTWSVYFLTFSSTETIISIWI